MFICKRLHIGRCTAQQSLLLPVCSPLLSPKARKITHGSNIMSRPCMVSKAVALLCLVTMSIESFLPRCAGCMHDERTALLDIYRQFESVWGGNNDSSSTGCCGWTGVTCNSRTGHVTGLDLGASTYVPGQLLNATWFLPLQELQSLSLAYIDIKGCIPGAGFEVWSKLRKLEILDLSGNELDDSSIPSLVALSSIRSLFLNSTSLSSAMTIQQLSTMKLEILDLSDNAITGTLPTGICSMENLRELYLSGNMLYGELPSCIGNLTSLRILDLSENQLTMKFPSISFANLTSLEKLYLLDNNLEGVFFMSSLSNNSHLTHLELASSGNHFQVQTENLATNLSAQLQVLVLRNCNLNGNSAITLSFMFHQHALEYIDMANNNLSGYFPSWLIENNMNLSHLIMRGNSFSGHLFLPPRVHEYLLFLDASSNKITKLPMNINTTLPYLEHLNLSGCSLRGVFPSVFGYMSSLTSLDLSSNSFLDNIGAAFVSKPYSLILSGNNFYGSLPQELPTNYSHLVLNNNKITGRIPQSICRSHLTTLDFSNNKLSGTVPICIGALQKLAILNLRGNLLVGPIPSELCHLENLMFLDVSKNNLSGPVHCLPNLQYLHMSENRFNGAFPIPLSLGTGMYTMDLRGNEFSGTLPGLMHKAFPKLKVLLLERNMFEGMIPNDICHLKYLRILDLSHNKLSGKLPSCLSNMGLDGDYDPFQYSDNSISDADYIMLLKLGYDDVDLLGQYRNYIWQSDLEEFMTKNRHNYYKGDILSYMSGLDFSGNQLNGSIPKSIGNMTWLRALNLSNNYLDGSIPKSLSNLSSLESLDLSHNNLTGQIPPKLVALQSLEVFSVAYNNLSGPTLGKKAQFITFDQSSYEGNPYLCGPPLVKSCAAAPPIPKTEVHGDDNDKVDDIILFGCSALFYIIGFWISLAVLYFKTSWRWAWFSAVDRFGDFLVVRSALFMRRIRGID